jgi:hypothetical protein
MTLEPESESMDFPQLLALPEEVQCEIIAAITTPSQISQLLRSTSHLRRLTRNCITHIRSTLTPNQRYGQQYLGFRVPFVLQFSHLQVVDDLIDVETVGDLILLANLPHLRSATFNFEGIFRSTYIKTIPGIRIPNFSPEMMRDWAVSFIQQYCSGYIRNADGSIGRNSRPLIQSNFTFIAEHFPVGPNYYQIQFDQGVVYFDNEDLTTLDHWVLPVINALHDYRSMLGLILNRDITRELVTTLLGMAEFHILVIETLEYVLTDKAHIRQFLMANTIDILREQNPNQSDEFPIEANTQLLLDLTSANPLRIADLPIQYTSLRQIVDTLESLELIGVAIPGSYLDENENDNDNNDNNENDQDRQMGMAVATVADVLHQSPRLRIKLWTDHDEYVDYFMSLYSGPRDRLVIR